MQISIEELQHNVEAALLSWDGFQGYLVKYHSTIASGAITEELFDIAIRAEGEESQLNRFLALQTPCIPTFDP